MPKQTAIVTKRKKFQKVEIPLVNLSAELIGENIEELNGRNIKLDLTRQLKGKGTELTFKVSVENNQLTAYPIKIKLMPYFIKRMIRKRISYVEDSFFVKSQESLFIVKPFLITRNRVSRAVRKTLRNKTRNWLEDYLSQKNDNEIFTDITSNKLQRTLSLVLKKTYPLSLCEIRILEIVRKLKSEEIPKKIEKEIEEKDGVLDQLEEIKEEKIKEAEKEIKKTQKEAIKKSEIIEKENKEIKKTRKLKKEEK